MYLSYKLLLICLSFSHSTYGIASFSNETTGYSTRNVAIPACPPGAQSSESRDIETRSISKSAHDKQSADRDGNIRADIAACQKTGIQEDTPGTESFSSHGGATTDFSHEGNRQTQTRNALNLPPSPLRLERRTPIGPPPPTAEIAEMISKLSTDVEMLNKYRALLPRNVPVTIHGITINAQTDVERDFQNRVNDFLRSADNSLLQHNLDNHQHVREQCAMHLPALRAAGRETEAQRLESWLNHYLSAYRQAYGVLQALKHRYHIARVDMILESHREPPARERGGRGGKGKGKERGGRGGKGSSAMQRRAEMSGGSVQQEGGRASNSSKHIDSGLILETTTDAAVQSSSSSNAGKPNASGYSSISRTNEAGFFPLTGLSEIPLPKRRSTPPDHPDLYFRPPPWRSRRCSSSVPPRLPTPAEISSQIAHLTTSAETYDSQTAMIAHSARITPHGISLAPNAHPLHLRVPLQRWIDRVISSPGFDLLQQEMAAKIHIRNSWRAVVPRLRAAQQGREDETRKLEEALERFWPSWQRHYAELMRACRRYQIQRADAMGGQASSRERRPVVGKSRKRVVGGSGSGSGKGVRRGEGKGIGQGQQR